MKLKREWHLTHPMPKNPTMEQRIVWHTEQIKDCVCSGIPEKIKKEIKSKSYQ